MTTQAENDINRGVLKRWVIQPTSDAAEALAGQLRLPVILGQLLINRGITNEAAGKDFLRPSMAKLHDPKLLAGCEKAAERIVKAVRGKEKIVLYGDYDVDGVTATSILFHLLQVCDQDVELVRYIPHRIDEGYGVHTQAIEEFAQQGAGLVVTVDCGITGVEPAQRAKELGIDMIITDHHEIGDELPDAYALVHPQIEREDGACYPFSGLCGAGVSYKLAWEIARKWCGSDTQLPNVLRDVLMDILPLAALGTIADVVPLTDENRVIVTHGLSRVKHTSNVGLNALIDASELRDEKIDSFHVGFVLGPRLNAAGRMGHAKKALWLLTDAPEDKAQQIARFLHGENEKRKKTERDIFQQASAMIEARGYNQDDVRVIVLGDAGWHVGVVGIVCSRLVERYGRPVILLNTGEEVGAGSARSIEGFNLHEALSACREHLKQFGGHAMAAGLQIENEKIDGFRDALMSYTLEHLGIEDLTPAVKIDAEAGLGEIDFHAIEQLQRLGPFGQANPQPVFLIRGVTLDQPAKTMGAGAKHLQMFIRQEETVRRCVGWNLGYLADRLPGGTEVDIVCRVGINEFRGRTYIDLNLQDIRIV